MMQDNLIGTGNSSKFAHEIKNLRFNSQGDYTTASWTVEKSTLKKDLYVYDKNSYTYVLDNSNTFANKIVLGQAVINDNLILFCKLSMSLDYGNNEFIYRLYFVDDKLCVETLYEGNLNFDIAHPIETLSYYENEYIQKVYWTDGINQPRVINVGYADSTKTQCIHYNSSWDFNFIKEVELNETVSITKHQNGAGQFPPCAVKYAITYYNKYGQESNIVWTSTLLYPTMGERGLKEGELSGDVFEISVSNFDDKHNFEYIRLYSILRTTNNATPVVRIVEDKRIEDLPTDSITSKKVAKFFDSNTTGEIIDPTILNYLGGNPVTIQTFDQKDNVLFMGNIHLKTKSLKAIAQEKNINFGTGEFTALSSNNLSDNIGKKTIVHSNNPATGLYPYKNQLNTTDSPKIFKYGEWYRFGIQFQDKYGVWSDVMFLNDAQNNTKPITDLGSNTNDFSVFKYTLTNENKAKLKQYYKRARLVCCYPTNADRTVLAQGAICPVVINQRWHNTHTPDFVSSWFWRKNSEMYGFIDKSEIQSIVSDYEISLSDYHDAGIIDADFPSGRSESLFIISKQAVTFHSPDIEFDESLRTLDISNVKFRIIGSAKRTSFVGKVYLDSTEPAVDYLGNKGKGFNNWSIIKEFDGGGVSFSLKNMKQDSSYPLFYNNNDDSYYPVWNDLNVYNGNLQGYGSDYQTDYINVNYLIYPFQRKYLNNYMGDVTIPIFIDNGTDVTNTIKESAVINNKVWSMMYQSFNTIYSGYNDININCCDFFDSNEVTPVRLKDGKYYYGNVNTLTPQEVRTGAKTTICEGQGLIYSISSGKTQGSRTHYYTKNIINKWGNGTVSDDAGSDEHYIDDSSIKIFRGNYLTDYYAGPGNKIFKPNNNNTTSGDYTTQGTLFGVSSDPIQISYKSTPHCIIELLNPQQTFPVLDNNNSIYIAELYRDDNDIPNRFGGTSEDALKNNVFIPCSKTYSLNTDSAITMVHDEGDTYYMRYDNLKTYPYTRQDINGIVDIFSFMCETRINLDGRSDTNRGLIDNTIIDNTNFNQINKSYTQTDNFFNYRVLDELASKTNDFPNQITWSRTKVACEDIDTWTNITLASVADSDGTLGDITKILNSNDTMVLFQKHGIGIINYNNSTAISTTNGVPLELAKSNRFNGIDYKSRDIGCQNKWSINNSNGRIFFIDNNRHELNSFTSEGIKPISTLNGFDSFFINNLENVSEVWKPIDSHKNFVTYYDNLSKDIYYINSDYCIAWNELTNCFTSFYDYTGVSHMANISQHCVIMKIKDGLGTEFYTARDGNGYSNYFGESKPYWITLLADGGTDDKGSYINVDKVFNTIEYKGDLFDENQPVLMNNVNMINMPLFTDIAAFNGYQAYREFKIDGRYMPKNNVNNPSYGDTEKFEYYVYPWEAERKFNIWRVVMPRATYLDTYGEKVVSRDRIRNLFAYIKLVNNEPDRYFDKGGTNNHRAIFSDFAVSFDMR